MLKVEKNGFNINSPTKIKRIINLSNSYNDGGCNYYVKIFLKSLISILCRLLIGLRMGFFKLFLGLVHGSFKFSNCCAWKF